MDGSNNLTLCTGAAFGLQATYNTGNTITTTTGRNIEFTLYNEVSDLGTPTQFLLTNAGTASAAFVINDTNASVQDVLSVQSSGSATLSISENGNLTTSGEYPSTLLNNII